MEENTVLDYNQVPVTPKAPNSVLNVFCILGYIANGFWAITLLILLLMGMESLQKLVPDLKMYDEYVLNIILYTLFFMFVLNVVSLVGLILSHKRKKAGVITYSIANGLWAILMLLAFQPLNMVVGLLSILFIVVIAKNYNK